MASSKEYLEFVLEQLAELDEIPVEVYWCDNCKTPIIKRVSDSHKEECPCCGRKTRYMAKDIRPVFPEERLLMELLKLKKTLKMTSEGVADCVFVLPKEYSDIYDSIAEYDAVKALMQMATDDQVLFEDYEVVYEDMREVLRNFINGYTRPGCKWKHSNKEIWKS